MVSICWTVSTGWDEVAAALRGRMGWRGEREREKSYVITYSNDAAGSGKINDIQLFNDWKYHD